MLNSDVHLYVASFSDTKLQRLFMRRLLDIWSIQGTTEKTKSLNIEKLRLSCK